MPKLVIFDLDGVLLNSCDIHFNALNTALRECVGESAVISRDHHETLYNGLSTRAKLTRIGLDPAIQEAVFIRKQELTAEAMKTVPARPDLHAALVALRVRGISVWCASNCIRATVETVLTSLGIRRLFQGVLSNEDVADAKPSPSMYLRCMELAGAMPTETLIFEDSYTGLCAAVSSGARVWRVAHPSTFTPKFIAEAVSSSRSNLMRDVNVVIPMAGNGSRFASAGYKDPKPFIPVFDAPMISWVVQNVGLDAAYTFIIRKEFEETYTASSYLQTLCSDASIITIDGVTEGAACTVLLASTTIDKDAPLLIINSDQYIKFSDCETSFKLVFDFLYNPAARELSGMISTFDGKGHPKWSYAKVNEDGIVTEVREKDPFSQHATTGLYLWRRGSDFVRYANQMISKNIRVNNEFYVVPVFNEAIADGHKFGIVGCERMWGIGVPEDLDYFLTHFTRGC